MFSNNFKSFVASLLLFLFLTTAAQARTPCNVCGSSGTATKPTALINVPGVGNVACGSVINKLVEGAVCSSLQRNKTIESACGCKDFVTGSATCTGATTLKLGETIHGNSGPSGFASIELCNDHTYSGGVWFRFYGTGNLVTIDTCQYADFPTAFALYVRSCSNGTFCFDAYEEIDNCVPGNPNSTVSSWNAVLGQEYYILIFGRGEGFAGNFALTISRSARPAPQPTPHPTTGPFCNLCAANSSRVTQWNPVSAPAFGSTSCDYLQSLIDNSFINRSTCSTLHANVKLQKTCGCRDCSVATSCNKAKPIKVGQVIDWSTFGVSSSGVNTTCRYISGDPPGAWYSFIGVGGEVRASVCLFNTFFSKVLVFNGSCSRLSCPNARTTTAMTGSASLSS